MGPVVPLYFPFMEENQIWISWHIGVGHWVIMSFLAMALCVLVIYTLWSRFYANPESQYATVGAFYRERSSQAAWGTLVTLLLLILSYFLGIHTILALVGISVLVGVIYIFVQVVKSAFGIY